MSDGEWKPEIIIRPLAMRVVAVATTRVEGTWRAYVDAVPGHCHRHEYQRVLDFGNNLGERYSKAIFPEFAELPYAR